MTKFKATAMMLAPKAVTLTEIHSNDLLDDEPFCTLGDLLSGPADVPQVGPKTNEPLGCLGDDMNTFMQLLCEAGSKITDHHYFQTHCAGAANPIYRERVYCYELYHMLRQSIGDDDIYRLDGEMDKKNHPAFKAFEKIPDFIMHIPGSHRGNLCVIGDRSFSPSIIFNSKTSSFMDPVTARSNALAKRTVAQAGTMKRLN